MDPATVALVNFLADLIVRIGFPIVVSGYLLIRLDKQVGTMIKALEGIASTNQRMMDKIEGLAQHNQMVVQLPIQPPANGGLIT